MMRYFYRRDILLLALVVLFHSRPSQELSDVPPFDEPALACLCQAFDKESSVKQNSSLLQSECLDNFDFFLSTLTVLGSNASRDTCCNNILQLLPQDYCGYPEDPEPFSLEKPPEICSTTNDKEKCSFETYLQPNTPCYWAEGRPCYWDSSLAECQGILTPWFTKTYGLSSNVTHICSKQRTKSSCRNTYMLGGHCTSWTIDGEDSNRVCARQLDKLTCAETTFSALRACIWQEKTAGWEAIFSSCCNDPPYKRPLAGSAWCANIGMNYVADGRVSANIGASTCDDIAGKYVRYQQSRDVYLELFGSAFVSTIDEACCRPSIISSAIPTVSHVLKPKTIPTDTDSLLAPSVIWKEPFKSPSLTIGKNLIPALPEGLSNPVQSGSPSKFISLPSRTKQPPNGPTKNTILFIKNPTLYQPTVASMDRPSAFTTSVPISSDETSAPSPIKNEAGSPQNTFHPSFRQISKPSQPRGAQGWLQSITPKNALLAPAQVLQQPLTSMQPSAWNYPSVAHEIPLRRSYSSTRPANKPLEASIHYPSLLPTIAVLNSNETKAPSSRRNASDLPINVSRPSIRRMPTSMQPNAWNYVTQFPLQYPSDKTPTQNAYYLMRPAYDPSANPDKYPTMIPIEAMPNGTATRAPSAKTLQVSHPSFYQVSKPSHTDTTQDKPQSARPSKDNSTPAQATHQPLNPKQPRTSNYATDFPSAPLNLTSNSPPPSGDSFMTPYSAIPSRSISYRPGNMEKIRVDGRGGGKAKVGAAAAALIALPLIGFLGYKHRNAPQDGGNDVKLDDI